MPTAFLITPFSPERAGGEVPGTFEAVQKAVQEAVARAGAELTDPRQMAHPGPIMDQIRSTIEDVDVVLAIITGQNPNVFYELGLAKRPAILICRSADDVPFDIRHQRYWTYGAAGELHTLPDRLEAAIRAALDSPPDRRYVHHIHKQGVPTPTGFAGYTQRGPTSPRFITTWDEFLRIYGGAPEPSSAYLWYAVRGFFDNGGRIAHISRILGANATCATVRVPTTDANQALRITACTPGAWGNHINVKITRGTRTGVRMIVGLGSADTSHPGLDLDNLSLDPYGPNHILDLVGEGVTGLLYASWADPALSPAYPQEGNFELCGGTDGAAPTVEDFIGRSATDRADALGLDALGTVETIGLVCVPDCANPTLKPKERHALTTAVIKHCEHHGDRFAILATPFMETGPSGFPPPPDTRFGAMYGPWVSVATSANGSTVLVPPVGHLAGIYARYDAEYGVHKAPVNETLRGLACPDRGLPPIEVSVTDNEQELLIKKGINGIRPTVADHTKVWVASAVTMSIDYRWRYVNVVRLLMFVTRALEHKTRTASSRTNDETTWSWVREQAKTVLSSVWHDGALFGRKPEEAFFVRCNQDTMTTDDILNGRLIYLIGLKLAAPPVRVMVLAQQPIGEELERKSQGRTTWRWFMEAEELSPSHGIGALIRQNEWK